MYPGWKEQLSPALDGGEVYPVFGFAIIPTGNSGLLFDIPLNLNDWLALGIIFLIGIPAFLVYLKDIKIKQSIDNNLPFLLREIADSQRIGMHLPRAIEEASKRNYGPLTSELRKLSAKVSWGVSFSEAMTSFRDNIDTPLSREATILILEAEKSGGDLEEIFTSATSHIQEQLEIKKERQSAIFPYLIIVYISFFIFLIVIYILFVSFFNYFGENSIATIESGTSNTTASVRIPIHAFRVAFFYVVLSQAFLSGITAGKMGSGSIKSGLLHSSVLIAVGFLFYKLTIG